MPVDGRQVGGGVEPQLGDARGRRCTWRRLGRRSATGRPGGGLLPREVVGDLPVDRVVAGRGEQAPGPGRAPAAARPGRRAARTRRPSRRGRSRAPAARGSPRRRRRPSIARMTCSQAGTPPSAPGTAELSGLTWTSCDDGPAADHGNHAAQERGMVAGQIRSGRSARRGGRSGAGRRVGPDERADDDVVVVGRGPIASARRAPAWGGHVRTLDELPEDDPQDALAGADGRGARRARRGPRRARRSRAAASGEAAIVAHTQRVLGAARAVGARHVVAIGVRRGARRLGRPSGDPRRRPAAPRATTPPVTDWSVTSLAAEAVLRARRGAAGRRSITVLRPAAVVGAGRRHVRHAALRGAAPAHRAGRRPAVAVRARRRPRRRRRGSPCEHRLAGVAHRRAPTTCSSPREVEAAAGHAADRAGRGRRRSAPPSGCTASACCRRRRRSSRSSSTRGPSRRTGCARRAGSRAGRAPRASTCCSRGCRAGSRVAGRRVGTRDAAALGAAGAAVALIGTAAVWRQARARRTGRSTPRCRAGG